MQAVHWPTVVLLMSLLNLSKSIRIIQTVGIIYDTHDAKIYENLCNTKLFVKFFGMPIDYTEQIKLIALKIRTLRKARKLTVQELAYRCDIERSNLSRIETGRSNPTVKTLCIICNALDVPLRALIE